MKREDKPEQDLARFLWIVVGGIVLYVVLDAIAQLLPPHYNPISQPESDLAAGEFGFIMAINFLNPGLLSLFLFFPSCEF